MNEADTKSDRIQWMDSALYDAILEKARSSPRRRMNHNFHESLEDPIHQFLNVMLHGTYIRPHRHLFPPKPESFLVIRGSIVFLIFDADGSIKEKRRLSAGEGIDIDPGIWHTLIVDGENAVCFEVKPGPYRKADDKEFAAWAPAEGDPETDQYLEKIYELSGYTLHRDL